MSFEAFTLEYLQSAMKKRGGRAFLTEERRKLQIVRDNCAKQMGDTLADIDGTLARLDLVLHDVVQA